MQRLLVYCDGGFGNRFNALVSGLHLAAALDLSPQVVWPVNNWCGAAFDTLFDSELAAIDRELATFVPERDRYGHLIVEDRLGLQPGWTPQQSPLACADIAAVRALRGGDTRDVFYYTALIPPFVPLPATIAQVRALRIRADITDRAEAFLRRHGIAALPRGDFMGVQIRKTDFGRNGADDETLYTLLQQRPQQRFFVCSDDRSVEDRFAALPNVLVHAKTAHVEKRIDGGWNATTADHSGRLYACNVNRSAQSVVDAVVDLLILSRSQVVKTSNSTFLNTALLLQAAR